MKKKTIQDIDVFDKRVLLRVDFNVPITDGKIDDDTRIIKALPTIQYLLQNGASVILMSHLGRPKGEINLQYSLKPVAEYLSNLLNKEVKFATDCVGEDAREYAKNLQPGEILLLENLRFYKQEEENDEEFSKKLASLADVYVNDAFGTAHRKHASTYGVAKLLPNAIGFLIEKELRMIVDVIDNPKKPFVGVLGGAKVSDKILVIESLLSKVDSLIIGGAMAYTFLSAKDYNMGKSKVEYEMIDEAKRLIDLARDKNVNLLLPVDHIITDNFDEPKMIKNTNSATIPNDFMGVDIGKDTIKLFKKTLKQAKTIIWNGPMGVFERKEFSNGTKQIAKALAKNKGIKIVGGGDSVSAVNSFGYNKKMTHISTGGGASLKLFEGKMLPAVDVIENL